MPEHLRFQLINLNLNTLRKSLCNEILKSIFFSAGIVFSFIYAGVPERKWNGKSIEVFAWDNHSSVVIDVDFLKNTTDLFKMWKYVW